MKIFGYVVTKMISPVVKCSTIWEATFILGNRLLLAYHFESKLRV